MHFSDILNSWYSKYKRELPWRNTTSPYHVWLSEIILQQTRVAQGLSYYNKFVKSYPNIEDLANDSEDNVLKLWQGLGYYSRARNLHATAKIISSEFNGVFPETYDEIIKLKGVGAYTAAAISSFCYGENRAVVDGNVYRVLSRYFGICTPIDSAIGKNEFQELAQECLSVENPGEHNQAIMEFGALQCTPNPNCETCPLRASCIAYANCMVKAFPVKAKKIKVRDRYFNFIVISDKDSFYIQKRESKDIWQNLYDFDLEEFSENTLFLEKVNLFSETKSIVKLQHKLTHQIIDAAFVVKKTTKSKNFKGLEAVPFDQINSFPIPTLIKNYLEKETYLNNSVLNL